MSILNLNTPQGGNSGGKKKAKMWMGAGLLAAVLGIGSTFAANITLNTPEGNTEFGQGVTQTVYCGANDELEEEFVTITPIAAYKNTVMNNGTPYVETLTATVKMLDGDGSSREVTVSNPESFRVTINSRSTSLFPRWNITGSTSSMTGYWISKNSTTLTNDSGVIVPTATQIVAQDVYFVEEERFGSRSPYTYGYDNAGTVLNDDDFASPRSVILAGAIPATSPTVSSEASFDLGGVKISNIPANCSGKNFVVSAYSETGTAKTLISGPISGSNVNITEIAALWRNTADATPTPSRDRTELRTASPLVTALEGTGSLKITFNQADGRTLMKAVDLYKLVVETQENALGLG